MKSNPIPPGRGMTLWERITRDPRYRKGRHQIQARYDLPLDLNIRLEPGRWSEWLGTAEGSTGEQARRGQAFLEEVQALFKRFQVPEAWQSDFLADIVGHYSEDEVVESVEPDPETTAQTIMEPEKRDLSETHFKKPWIEVLWDRLRKWRKRA